MASGIGEIAILPGMRDIWGNLTGNPDPLVAQNPAQLGNWFGQDPMGWGGATMDAGRRGQLISRGPQSATWQTPTQGSWNQISTPYGVNSALFGSSFNPAMGQSAYERFADSGDSYLRRYGTDVRSDAQGNQVLPMLDAQGNPVGYGQGVRANPAWANATLQMASPERNAGERMAALFGGRNGFNNPLTGETYGTHTNFANMAAMQQGANPFLNDPRMASQMVRADEQSSPFARANPTQYLATALGAEGTTPTTASVANSYVNPSWELGGRGVSQMGGLVNSYEQSLMDQMARQGSKDLSLGIEDARNQLSSMGLGRSGQGQSTAAGVWENIQQKNALDRQQLMAQFAEAGMGRQAQAILGQQTGGLAAMQQAQQAAAGGAESRFGRMNAAAMGGMNALTASLEGSRAAQRGAMGQGMANTLAWNQGTQGNYLQSLIGADRAALDRMNAQAATQSQGLGDYMRLQATKDAMRQDRMNEMLGLEDRYRTGQNEVYNQMAQYGMMGPNMLMQMITGIAPTSGSQTRTSPWGAIGGQLGAAAISALPQTYTNYRNQYEPNPLE